MKIWQTLAVGAAASAWASVAQADQCIWVTKAQAQKAVKILESVDRMIDYCELCGGDAPVEKRIQEVTFKPVPGQNNKSFEVSVNGEAYDLAYVFVPLASERNKFENLAKRAGCATTGVSAFFTYPPEKVPESWAGTYAKPQVTLILEQPTAGPWYHAQLTIRAAENGNDRVEVTAQADKGGDEIRFGTPFKACSFTVKKLGAGMSVTSAAGCGAFGTAISGSYGK